MPEAEPSPDGKPYVGPRTFEPEEKHLFFGRKREQRDLTALIVAKRIVLFYAASGAGKSSLFNTKIIPGLKQKGFETLPVGSVSGHDGRTVEAENIFVYNLVSSLHEAEIEPPGMATLTLPAFLDRAVCKDGAFQYDADYEYGEDAVLKPRVLLIDQFEEILTTNSPFWQQREGFFEQLGEALYLDKQLWLVLAMREDFVAGLDPYLHLLPTGLRYRYYMQPLSRRAALQAIRNPVEDIRPFEEEAAVHLVDNLLTLRSDGEQTNGHKAQFVEPVQLQAVCYQMWEKLQTRPGSTITVKDVEDFANVDKALIDFYQRTIAETVRETSVTEVDLRNWFGKELITDSMTRNMIYRGEELTGSLKTEIADYVLKRFILREVVRPGGIWYELVHDRFVGPIIDSNREWRLDQPLLKLAQGWLESGRKDEALLDGRQLERFLQTNWQALGPLVTEFVETSENVRRQEEEEERQREVERQRERAEEARRLTRIALAMLAVAVLLALLAGFFGFQSRSNAEVAESNAVIAAQNAATATHALATAIFSEAEAIAETTRAVAAQATADHNAALAATREQDAVAAEATADAERALVIFENQRALAQSLQNSSRQVLGSQPTSQALALSRLLAIEAAALSAEVGSPAEQAGSTGLLFSLVYDQPVPYAPLASFPAHASWISDLDVSPDGSLLASASHDSRVIIWDTSSWIPVKTLNEHTGEVYDVAWNGDGNLLASTSCGERTEQGSCTQSEIIIWDANNWEPLTTLGEHSDLVYRVAWSGDGSRLASASADSTIVIWDMNSWEPLTTLIEPEGDVVYSVAWNADGSRLASTSCGMKDRNGACTQGEIVIWDANNWEPLTTLGEHSGEVYNVAWNQDGSRLASASGDNTAIIWDTASWTQLATLSAHRDNVYKAIWEPEGRRLATSSADGTVVIWDTGSWQPLTSLTQQSDLVYALAWSEDGNSLASAYCAEQNNEGACSAADIIIWDTASWEPAVTLADDRNYFVSPTWSPDGNLLAAASEPATVTVWNTASWEPVVSLTGNSTATTSVAWSPEGNRLATAACSEAEDGDRICGEARLTIWETETMSPIATLENEQDIVFGLAWNPDGSQLASASLDGTMIIWDATTWEPVTMLSTVAIATSWSPDGRFLASESCPTADLSECSAFELLIWDTNSWQAVNTLNASEEIVFSLAWNPDGSRLASPGDDNTVIIWETESWERLTTLSEHEAPVTSLAWSADGSRLASGSSDNRVTVWDVAGEVSLGTLSQHTDTVTGVAWSPDGSRLATTGEDGRAIVWSLPDFAGLNCELAGRNMSLAEYEQYLPGEAYRCTCGQWPAGDGAPPNVPGCTAESQ